MSVLGLDVAKHKTGYAYRTDQWVFGTLDIYGDCKQVFEDAAKHCSLCVIEEPWLHPDREKRNVRTFGSLKEAAARAQLLAEMAGMAVERVSASTWQNAWGLPRKRAEGKAAALVTARRLGADVNTDDEADAVLLSEYARSQQDIMERVGNEGTKRGSAARNR